MTRMIDDLTVEEMLAAADDVAGDGLGARLDAIRHQATDGGIAVTVDLHGKLVGLTIDHRAMRLPAHELAGKLRTLTDKAAEAAVDEALTVLGTVCDDSLVAELAAHVR